MPRSCIVGRSVGHTVYTGYRSRAMDGDSRPGPRSVEPRSWSPRVALARDALDIHALDHHVADRPVTRCRTGGGDRVDDLARVVVGDLAEDRVLHVEVRR